MEDMTAFQKVKTGFWLGIGFTLPIIIAFLVSLVISYALSPTIFDYAYEDNDDDEGLMKQIEITNYNESYRGDRLIILGTITNRGPKEISSIKLQAELFDREGNFVHECDKRISRNMKSGENENFQIVCDCSKSPAPEYESITLRVISANNY